MKKALILSVFTAAALLALTPTTPVKAGAGTWDAIGAEGHTVGTSFAVFNTMSSIPSGGGDFKVTVDGNNTGGNIIVRLYESDGSVPGTYTGREVTVSGLTGDAVFSNISSWVDGSNNQAEFYVELKTNGSAGYVHCTYYD